MNRNCIFLGRKDILRSLISALIFLLGCSKQVATVGDIRISEKDIELRAKVSEIYYPESGKRYVALSQLIKGYLSLQLLKSLGYNVNGAVLEGEVERIDKNTKAPDVLRRIKEVYSTDRTAYLRTFVQVVYAERVLYNEVFLKSKEIHRGQYLKADGIIKEALRNPEMFGEIIRRNGFETTMLKLSSKDGITLYLDKRGLRQAGAGDGRAGRLVDAVSTIRQGDVYPEVIEWLEGYQVIRFIKKEKKDFIVESVFVPKRSYDEWFWEKASKIPVRIHDEVLKNELLKEVSWAKNLRTG